MKQRIFNRGKGWYISASNYKDPDDKAYLNIFFPGNTDPAYRPTGDQGFVFIDIDIQEQKYTSYKGKIGLTVFKYEIIPNEGKLDEVDAQNNDFAQQVRGTEYEKNFGAVGKVEPEDLPFY